MLPVENSYVACQPVICLFTFLMVSTRRCLKSRLMRTSICSPNQCVEVCMWEGAC